ncbi:MAG: SAM-dependent methyltransferase [Proteobacteria bacterium]|nr:SAM-dependent methyltransferase [Pseudomonadota bacterium]
MSAVSMNVVRHGAASRTAQAVAALRAVHQLLDEPLVLPDPVALPMLGLAAEAALRADPFVLNDPLSRALRAALVARGRVAEDELAQAVADGVRQYVVLGAGLDTFAYRNPYRDAGLRVFEVDHPGTQADKRQRLAEAGIELPPSLSFAALDFERDDLRAALQRAGFRAEQPACIAWLGVTMYLTADAVLATLRALAGLAAGSRLCFDHVVPAAMLNPIERVVTEVLAHKAAEQGEPWLSSFDPPALRERLLEMGFAAAESVTPDELNRRYFARRRDGLRAGEGARIVCARA